MLMRTGTVSILLYNSFDSTLQFFQKYSSSSFLLFLQRVPFLLGSPLQAIICSSFPNLSVKKKKRWKKAAFFFPSIQTHEKRMSHINPIFLLPPTPRQMFFLKVSNDLLYYFSLSFFLVILTPSNLLWLLWAFLLSLLCWLTSQLQQCPRIR